MPNGREGQKPHFTHIPPQWTTLNKVQFALNVTDESFAELFGMSAEHFVALKAERRELPFRSLFEASSKINVPFDALVCGQVDYVAMAQQFRGDATQLPRKYLEGANSKRRTVVNILNFIEERFGWPFRLRVMQRFQLRNEMFEDPDGLINLRLSVDICHWILRQTGDPNIMVEMGYNSVKTNLATPLGQFLAQSRSPREVYERMFGGLAERFVERNFIWKISRFSGNSCWIQGYPDSEIVGVLGESYAFAETVCDVRQGFVGSLPGYIGLGMASVTKLSCVSQGDAVIEFEVDLVGCSKRWLKLVD